MRLLRESARFQANRLIACLLLLTQLSASLLSPLSAQAAEQTVAPTPSAGPINFQEFGCVVSPDLAGVREPIITARTIFGGVAGAYSFLHEPIDTRKDQAASAEVFRADVTGKSELQYAELRRSDWKSVVFAQSGYAGLRTSEGESNGVFEDASAEIGKSYLYVLRAEITGGSGALCSLSTTVSHTGKSSDSFESIVAKVGTEGRTAVEGERALALPGDTVCGNVINTAIPVINVIVLGCGLVVLVREFSIFLLYQSMAFLAITSGLKFTSDIKVSEFVFSGILPQEFIGIDLQNKLIGIGNSSSLGAVVLQGHGLILNLVNIILIIGFLIIALANILQIQIKTYEIKKILPALVIGFLLANFSLFIVRASLELVSMVGQGLFEVGDQPLLTTAQNNQGQVTYREETNTRGQTVSIPSNLVDEEGVDNKAFIDRCKGDNSQPDLRCFVVAVASVGGDPAARLTVPRTFQAPSGWSKLNPFAWVGSAYNAIEGPDIFAIFFQAILNLLVIANAVIFFWLGVIFVLRTIVIYFLAPISPLGFMGMVVPQMKKVGDTFKTNLGNWLTMPLVSFFWIWLGFMWLRTTWNIQGFTPNPPNTVGDAVYFSLPTIPTIITYVFMMICMSRALKSPSSMAGELKGIVDKLASKPGKAWEKTGGKAIKIASAGSKFAFGQGLSKLEGAAKLLNANRAANKQAGNFKINATNAFNKASQEQKTKRLSRAMELRNQGLTPAQAMAQARNEHPELDRASYVASHTKGQRDQFVREELDKNKQNVVGWLRGFGHRGDAILAKLEEANKSRDTKVKSDVNMRLQMGHKASPGSFAFRAAGDISRENSLLASDADAATKADIEKTFHAGGPVPGLATLNRTERRLASVRKAAREKEAKSVEEKESLRTAYQFTADLARLGKNIENIEDPTTKEMYKHSLGTIRNLFDDEVKKVKYGQVSGRNYSADVDGKLWASINAGGSHLLPATGFADSDAQSEDIITAANQYAYLHGNIVSRENHSPQNHNWLLNNFDQMEKFLASVPGREAELREIQTKRAELETAHQAFMRDSSDTNQKARDSKVKALITAYQQGPGTDIGSMVSDRGKYSL